MNTSKTISVEPGKITLADRKSKEKASELLRVSILDNREEKKDKLNLINIIFPTQKTANNTYVKYSIPLRSIFSALLIITGISSLQLQSFSHQNITIGILEIIFGSFLGLGLFTRGIMALSTVMFGIIGLIGLRSGFTDITSFSLMFGSLIFFVMGAGKYSCDALMRKNLKRRIIANKIKNQQDCLSYRAFKCATRNI